MSSVERQRRYRERQREAAAGRINTYISGSAEGALKRLAQYHGLSQRAMLEKLVADAEAELLRGWPLMDQQRYYRGEAAA